MLNAGFKGTELSASVGQGMREIPTASVKNVRSIQFAPQSQSFTGFFLLYNLQLVVRVMMSVLSLKHASKENVRILVPMNSVASKLSAL